MNTLTINDVTTPAASNNTTPTKKHEHLSLNSAGAIRVLVVGTKTQQPNGNRRCTCGNCMYCNERDNSRDYVSIDYRIQSYNAVVGSDSERITFPSVEAFVEYQKFIAELDVKDIFNVEAKAA